MRIQQSHLTYNGVELGEELGIVMPNEKGEKSNKNPKKILHPHTAANSHNIKELKKKD
jgi:hypothetical protein